MAGPHRFDLFLSCAGPDRVAARALATALENRGLRVFLDERSIGIFDSINEEIEQALRDSTALLAYYSRHFSRRTACQQELTAAFLAGLRENDPMRRILVINPEDPHTDHLLPTQLTDARYPPLRPAGGRPVSERDFRDTASSIRTQLDRLTGTIGDAALIRYDRTWYGRSAGSAGFAGRYPEQWALHTALHDPEFPLTRAVTAVGVAVVVGMAGIGKTALTAAYAWNFGAAYAEGSVCWIDLTGAGPTDADVLARYDDEVRILAEGMGVDPRGSSLSMLLGRVADRLEARAGQSLWVIDNVPTGLGPATVGKLLLPGGAKVRTILTCHEDQYGDVARTVALGPMPDADIAAMLEHFRTPSDDERDGFDRLVPLLRGHPLVARSAAADLQDRQGLVSFADYADLLTHDADPVATVAELLRPALQRLDEPARLILQLAGVGAPSGLPARYVQLVVDRLLGTGLADGALIELKNRALAAVDGSSWRIHQLAVDAAGDLDSPVLRPALLATAATVIELLADGSGPHRNDLGELMRQAAALSGAAGVEPDVAVRLAARAAAFYERRGEPVLAAPLFVRVATLAPDPAAFAAAAEAQLAAGDYEASGEWAARAAGSHDPAAVHRGRRTRAEALEALGRYDDAERDWQVLGESPPLDDALQALRTEVARLRSLRLRGRLADVKARAPGVIRTAVALGDDAAFDLGRTAELDLARAEVLTDGQRTARQRAQGIIEAYAARGVPDHARALEALEVLAEARLTMHLWELNPDQDDWRRAEADLHDRYESSIASHGRRNPLTLIVGVHYTYALVSQGHRTDARKLLDALLPAVQQRLGRDHPIYFRAVFLSGLIHAQRGQDRCARPLFEEALAGQRATLGPGHAHTLRTQYELAVVLKLGGDPGWRELMVDVRNRAPNAVGRVNDLYTQSLLALGLLTLPAPLVRAVAHFGRPSRDEP